MFCGVQLLSFNCVVVICDMQGHSTAASLPPLPENGPTEETKVQEVEAKGDHSPIPSANTSHVEEETADEAQTEGVAASDHEVDAALPKRRRLVKAVSSSMSSPVKEQDLEDDKDSGSSPVAKAAPLTVCPLSSISPPQSSGAMLFGGPNFTNLDSEEEEERRFVQLLMV